MLQVILNSAVDAAMFTLLGLSFALILRTARFFHVAHGFTITAGAYATFALESGVGMPRYVAVVSAMTACGVLGWGMEWCVYRPLRRKGSSSLVMLLVSIALYVILQNLVSVLFGDGSRTFRGGEVVPPVAVLGVRLPAVHVAILLSGGIAAALVAALLGRTGLGLAIRAVACDAPLAAVAGMNTGQVLLVVFAIGSALAGLGGVLLALQGSMVPSMGLPAVMMAMVVAVVGGRGGVGGVLVAGCLLGLAQNLLVWFWNAQWTEAGAFAALVLFLLFQRHDSVLETAPLAGS